MKIGPHNEVYEYDGAYGCTDCKKKWGALPDVPESAPESCREDQITTPNKIINGVLVLAMGMAGCSGADKRNKAMWDCVDRIPAVEMSDAERMFLVRGCLYIGRTK